jgi:hypothetical protein
VNGMVLAFSVPIAGEGLNSYLIPSLVFGVLQEYAFSGSASQWSPIQRSLFTSPCFISSIHRVLSYQEEKSTDKDIV